MTYVHYWNFFLIPMRKKNDSVQVKSLLQISCKIFLIILILLDKIT